jgi:hypothetical protein
MKYHIKVQHKGGTGWVIAEAQGKALRWAVTTEPQKATRFATRDGALFGIQQAPASHAGEIRNYSIHEIEE